MADDEIIEGGEEAYEEEAPASTGQAFTPELSAKPKSNVYTVLLVLTFLGFLTSIVLGSMELYDFYDVQFYLFNKKGG